MKIDELKRQLNLVPQWRLLEDGKTIERVFTFDTYKAGLDFAVKVGALAEAENHHPDMIVAHKKVTVRYSTHSEGAVTDKDFRSAAKSDMIFL